MRTHGGHCVGSPSSFLTPRALCLSGALAQALSHRALLPGTSVRPHPLWLNAVAGALDGASVSMLPARLPVSWERRALPTDSTGARRESVQDAPVTPGRGAGWRP